MSLTLMKSQNRKFGKVTRERQCDALGKYKKGAGSVSLLMAISGDERVGEAFSFHRCFTEGGTNLWRFFNYMHNTGPAMAQLSTYLICYRRVCKLKLMGWMNKINVIIGGMPSFKRYFLHVGFPDN